MLSSCMIGYNMIRTHGLENDDLQKFVSSEKVDWIG